MYGDVSNKAEFEAIFSRYGMAAQVCQAMSDGPSPVLCLTAVVSGTISNSLLQLVG